MAVLVTGSLFAQNRQVTGNVVDSEGSPIVGAVVAVEGASTVAITGVRGEFAISAPANGTLSVSSIGYTTQQVAIENRTIIEIVMEQYIEAIDDVIVVAFGTAKREAFTGSAAVVSAEQIEKRQTTNVLNSLVGSVPGLQIRGTGGQPGDSPGSRAEGGVNIRGISSMFAETAPLVILDGAPYPASLSNIPQADIESVTVLKDAASAALYGARGASGVIIVTTKRAHSGDAVINFDMRMGVNSRAMQMYDVITDPGEYYEAYFTQLYNRNHYGADQLSVEAATARANVEMLSNLQYDVFSRPQGEWLVGSNGRLNPNATLGREYTYNGNTYWLTPDNWLDAAYNNNMRQEYNLSVNGGSGNVSYYSSLSYLNDGGIVDNSSYERIGARLKADFQAKKWLRFGANVGYTRSIQDQNSNWGTEAGSSNLFYYASGIAPIYPIFVRGLENGKPVVLKDKHGNDMYDYGVASMGGYEGLSRPFLGTGNPLGENQYNSYDVLDNQLNGTLSADVSITDFLKASVSTTVNWGQSNTSQFGNMFYGTPAVTNGYIQKTVDTSYRTNNLQTVSYFDTFGHHNINAMIGHEFYDQKTSRLMGRGQGMFSPDIQELDGSALPHFDASSNIRDEHNVEGYFLSAQYDYDSKYYASLSYRRDASSYFAPENRWGDFWSIGGAWIMSKENFLASATWIDMLKLKASIGQQGNDAIGSYQYIDRFDIVDSGDGIHMSPVPVTKGNRDITWETTTNFNVGVEFSLFKGRLSGVIDLYNKKTTDLLFWMSIPESSGFRGMYDNIGDLRNSGIEVTLNGTVIRTNNVDWSINANITHNKTKILSLPEAKTMGRGGFNQSEGGTIDMWYKVGGPMYNAYMPEFAGIDENGESLFYINTVDEVTGEKILRGDVTTDFNDASANARYEQGSMLPKAYGGFGSTLRVKDFDVSVTFDYQIGGKVYDGYYASTVSANESVNRAGSAIHKDWIKSWNPETNPDSNMPRWQFGDRFAGARSSRFLTDASYLNFQSFMIGYTVPQSLLKDKVKIRVYAAGENLFFWSARKGLDPRYAYIGNGMVLDYSPMRTISGGLQLTF